MPRHKWTPPPGTVAGECPCCRQFVDLTPRGYVGEHRAVLGDDGRVVGLWPATRGLVLRCSGVGRDPLKHECVLPEFTIVGSTWTCGKCRLRWVAGRVGGALTWRTAT